MDDAGAQLRAQRLRLIFHGFSRSRAGDIGQAGIVGDVSARASQPVFWPMTTTDCRAFGR